MKEFDTICAIATALGEGGISIIRISGDKALDIADKIFKAKNNFDIKNMKSYTMKYGYICDINTGDVIESGIEPVSAALAGGFFTTESPVKSWIHFFK